MARPRASIRSGRAARRTHAGTAGDVGRARRDDRAAASAASLTRRTPAAYRIEVFGEPRAPWRSTVAQAIDDAISLGLASYDEERDEHYLAVPVALVSRPLSADC